MSTITGLTSSAVIHAQQLVQMQQQLSDLSSQLGSGKKAQTYGGLGIDRGLDVNLRGSLSRLDAYEASVSTVNTRVQLQNLSLDRLVTISQNTQSQMLAPQGFKLIANGQTNAQIQARDNLDESLSLLNQI